MKVNYLLEARPMTTHDSPSRKQFIHGFPRWETSHRTFRERHARQALEARFRLLLLGPERRASPASRAAAESCSSSPWWQALRSEARGNGIVMIGFPDRRSCRRDASGSIGVRMEKDPLSSVPHVELEDLEVVKFWGKWRSGDAAGGVPLTRLAGAIVSHEIAEASGPFLSYFYY